MPLHTGNPDTRAGLRHGGFKESGRARLALSLCSGGAGNRCVLTWRTLDVIVAGIGLGAALGC